MRIALLAAMIRRLRRQEEGVSAVEFALLLPVMLILFFGCVEVGDALTIDRKVTHVASTLADLVTQSKSVTSTDVSNIFGAAASILSPYSSATLKMKVSGVTVDSKGNATVTWSKASNDTALTKGTPLTMPAAMMTPSTFTVVAEVHFPYRPTVGYVMTGSFDLHSTFYLRPRASDKVCLDASTC
ncbi:MAG: pilus assembly protein [Rhizobiales bacterium]|nr:pilus assembly protein [Hyphomicrobiales bacterium]